MRLIVVVACLIVGALFARAVVIDGAVYDMTEAPIADIAVTAMSPDSTALSYDLTNDKGEFRIKLAPCSLAKIVLLFSGFGYERRCVNCDLTGKISPIKVKLASKEFELNEFVVTAAEMYRRGDTINYNVDAFKSAVDRKIEDVLQKMPGITVDNAGKIEFNGKKVSSVMVEGLNLTGNNYEQLTQGVNADDISSVQVLINNQKVKMLRGVVPSDQVDLNLKLHTDKKDVWTLNALAGIGDIAQSDIADAVSYGVNASSMRFGVRSQTFSSLEVSNNQQAGKAATLDDDFSGDEEYASISSMLQPISTTNPNFSSNKQQGQSIANLKSNWLWRSTEDVTTRLNIGVSKTGLTQKSSAYKEYNTIAGLQEQRLEQSNDLGKKASYIDVDVQDNGPKKYLMFNSHSNVDYDKLHAQHLLNGASRVDAQKNINFSTQNDFSYKGLLGNDRILDVTGSLSYASLSDKFSVIGSDGLAQTSYQNLNVGLSTNYIFKLWGVRFNCNSTLDYLYHSLGASVDNTAKFGENRARLTVNPSINYKFNKFSIRINAPITLQWSKFDARHKLRALCGATASAALNIGALWRVGAIVSVAQKEHNLYDVIPYAFNTSFDTQRMGCGEKGVSNNVSASVNVSFNDMLKGYSAYVMATILRAGAQPIVKVTLTDDVSLFETTSRREPMTNQMLRGQISKRISAINGILSLSTQLSNTRSYSLSHDEVYPQNISSGGVKFNFAADLCRWLNCNVGAGVSLAKQSLNVADNPISNKVTTYSASCKTSFMWNGFIGSMSVDLMKNSIPNATLLSLYDASASYKWSRFEVGLLCENLLNNKSYVRKTMTATLNQECSTVLMPRHVMVTFAVTF
jgi:hypothetical protein